MATTLIWLKETSETHKKSLGLAVDSAKTTLIDA